jgi:MoxR-like ATPase
MSVNRDGREPLASVRDRVQASVVGRERELDLVLAAVAAGRDILLEGPPGTSKSTLLRAITREWGIPLVFVEGNADLTPAKLVGHHNPARVLREDYSPENFVDGPLLEAMRAGGFLYIEEFNRAPEDTLNTLLTAMAERRIAVPRVGEVVAGDTFRVIASMNPYDNIGTTRLSTSVHDRLCRLAITYQDAAAERGIVALRAPQFGQARVDQALADLKPALYERLVADAVAVTRATRAHADIRQGSSVRGAIDLTLVAGQLFDLAPERLLVSSGRADDPAEPAGPAGPVGGTTEWDTVDPSTGDPSTGDPSTGPEQFYRETVYDAMVVALSGRIFLDETVEATPEQVLRQIWEDHFILGPAAATPG